MGSKTWGRALVVLLILAAPAVHAATPALPDEVFSPHTFLLVRVRVEGMTAAKIDQALRAVLDPIIYEALELDLASDMAPIETRFRGKLAALGVESLVLVVAADPALEDSTRPVFLAPLGGEGKAERLAGVKALVADLPVVVRRQGGWIMMWPKELPPQPDLMTMRDAPFIEGLSALPEDHDVSVVFAPRGEADEGIRDQVAGFFSAGRETDESTPLAKRLREQMKVDWYGASVRFGEKPELRLVIRPENAEKATALVATMTRMFALWKDQIREDHESDEDADDESDETQKRLRELGLAMVDALAVEADGPHVVMHLDSVELKALVAPFEAYVRIFAEGIAELAKKAAENEKRKKERESNPDGD